MMDLLLLFFFTVIRMTAEIVVFVPVTIDAVC
jgi:hypothetical protein